MYFIGSSEEASLVVTSDITAVADGDLDTVWAERIVSDYDTTIKLDLDKPGQVCRLLEVLVGMWIYYIPFFLCCKCHHDATMPLHHTKLATPTFTAFLLTVFSTVICTMKMDILYRNERQEGCQCVRHLIDFSFSVLLYNGKQLLPYRKNLISRISWQLKYTQPNVCQLTGNSSKTVKNMLINGGSIPGLRD